jgi:transposase
MENQITQWEEQTLYAGIDLHKTKWVVTVRTTTVVLKTFVTNPDKEVLLKTFLHLYPGAKIRAVYEAGCFGYHLAEFLNTHSIETIIVAPHTIPVAPGQFVKTDIIDSRKLAFELAKGSITGIYCRSQVELLNRGVIRKRQQLVKRRTQLGNQIKGDLKFYGIEGASFAKSYWSKKALAALKSLDFGSEPFCQAFRLAVEDYEYTTKQIKAINTILLQLISSEKYQKSMELLLSIPGVGRLTAITILVEIGDIRRFTSAERFASYLGLTPSEHSSGDAIRKGSLTGMGHSSLRALLIEVSWQAIKKDPVLLIKFQRVSVGKSKTQAIVAVAKSLANRVRHVLLNQERYVIGVVV